MKTFKEYRAEKQIKFFPWSASFADKRSKDAIPQAKFFPWSASFSDDKKSLKESYKVGTNMHDQTYNADFHDHPDVIPKKLLIPHIRAISHYTAAGSGGPDGHGSSHNMNSYLRNRAEGSSEHRITGPHGHSAVLHSVKLLASAFTPENTNRTEIKTHGGIPPKYGQSLSEMKPGQMSHFPGFTSTSSSRATAHEFARDYLTEGDGHDGKPHMIKYTVKPGAGLSVVHHSTFPEDEVVLNHGAKIEYSHTTEDDKAITHHVTVHPDSRHIDHYGAYNEPKKD